MKIAVDFDGTIVEHRFPAIGDPRPMAFDVLKALQKEGHSLILWSNREGKRLEEAVEFCRQRGLEFYSVNSDYPHESWSGSGVSRKLIADVYIDDKNIGGLPDWSEIYMIVSSQSNKEAELAKMLSNGHHRHVHHRKRKGSLSGLLEDIVTRCREARNNFKL